MKLIAPSFLLASSPPPAYGGRLSKKKKAQSLSLRASVLRVLKSL
jgi:hypothetical protein